MKSILIVTQQFTIGGLETHIRGEIEQLSAMGIEVHLATGSTLDKTLLPSGLKSITAGLVLEPSATAQQTLKAIEKLRQLIREHRIDRLHIHPFTSIVPAAIAAELEAAPYALTLHGPDSLGSFYGPTFDAVLKDAVLPNCSAVFAVSPEVKELAAVYVADSAIQYIPNAVSMGRWTQSAHAHTDHWLVVSRLDDAKVPGVLDFCVKAKESGIPRILIAGDGAARPMLESWLQQRGLEDFVQFLGAIADVGALMSRAAGIAGMGRVLLEGIAACKPVVLVGYDGVKGVLDCSLFERAARANFSGRGLPTVDGAGLREQLAILESSPEFEHLHNLAQKDFDEKFVWENFAKYMGAAQPPRQPYLQHIYACLQTMPVNDETPYLNSLEFLSKLETEISENTANWRRFEISILLAKCRLERELDNKVAANMVAKISDKDVQISDLKQQLTDLNLNINGLRQNIVALNSQVNHFSQSASSNEQSLKNIHCSASWRITYPLRLTYSAISKFGTPLFTKLPVKFQRQVLNKINPEVHSVSGNRSEIAFKNLASDFSESTNNTFDNSRQQVLEDDLVIIAGVPFDDVGGGQRSAQLARCALKTGRRVTYIHIYKKFDFEVNAYVDSHISIFGLDHFHIDEISPEKLLRCISSNSTLLIELPHPAALPYLKAFSYSGMRTVFELIDDWETSLGGDWFNMGVYRDFVEKAESVVGTARLLVERLRNLGRADALYLPNAANEYIFDKYKNYQRPKDLPADGYIGLYFGSLYGEWFAWEFLEEAAHNNPGIKFVLIGDRPQREHLPKNIILLGPKQIDELPAYLAYSDFTLLPFTPGKISDAVSPIKVFEYLFAGKPVVSTNLPEINGYPGLIIKNTPAEYSAACAEVVKADCGKLNALNDNFIWENSWFSRLDKITLKNKKTRFEKSVSVIILIHNNIKIIERTLSSLLCHCTDYIKEIIVVDNCSVDGGAQLVREKFPSVLVVSNPVNGCASGRNLGLQSATGKYISFFDSDQWFTSSSCFDEALSILDRDANVGAIGWAAGWFDASRDDFGGMITDYCPNRGMNAQAIRKGYRSDVAYLGTGGFFARAAVIRSTQGFDVAYDPTCFEDTDMSLQIKDLGLDICYRDLTGIRHQPHQTTSASGGSDAYVKLFKRNADYFREKWKHRSDLFIDYTE